LFFDIAPLGKSHVTCAAEGGAGSTCQHDNLTMKTRQNGGAQCVISFELFVFQRAVFGNSLIARKTSPEQEPDGHRNRSVHWFIG